MEEVGVQLITQSSGLYCVDGPLELRSLGARLAMLRSVQLRSCPQLSTIRRFSGLLIRAFTRTKVLGQVCNKIAVKR